tara:strand:+ start:256 stop:516 length:261 start_codon:yes stop_codon:yes gene_type:complete
MTTIEFKNRIIKYLSYTHKLTSHQKIASRLGYMGAGFLMAAHWTLEPILYVLGFSLITIQTASRKQWNLVVLQINGLIAWLIHSLT